MFDQLKNKLQTLEFSSCPLPGYLRSEIELNTILPEITCVKNNGYQSWSESGEYAPSEKGVRLRKWAAPIWKYYKMELYGDHLFTMGSGDVISHGYILFKLKEKCLLLGQKPGADAFLHFEWHWDGRLEIFIENQAECFDNIELHVGKEAEVFDQFWGEKRFIKRITGWTSWYQYYTNINQELILEHAEAYSKSAFNIDLIQIDDGWQRSIGEWVPNSKFVNLFSLPNKIKNLGFRSGIWLAPFICDQNSWIFHERPNWIARHGNGNKVIGGRNPLWGGLFYVLDIELEEVRSYLADQFCRLKECGYDFFKLDFLYVLGLIAPKGGKAPFFMRYYTWLRNVFGDSTLLGCGTPLMVSKESFDYCRVSADVGVIWEDWRLSKLLCYPERISTSSNIKTTRARAMMDQRLFGLDPDVWIWRKEGIRLGAEPKDLLFEGCMEHGSLLFTSDHPDQWSKEKLEWIRKRWLTS